MAEALIAAIPASILAWVGIGWLTRRRGRTPIRQHYDLRNREDDTLHLDTSTYRAPVRRSVQMHAGFHPDRENE